jgi:iron complex transport system substrate-binding protein
MTLEDQGWFGRQPLSIELPSSTDRRYRMSRRRSVLLPVAILALGGLLATACGDGEPVTIDSDGGTWTLDTAPGRIVSLSPAATEILFAIGAGPQVVAVDDWSTYPPEAPVTELSGFDPNVEAVTAYDPDLVVIAFDTNDLVAALTALDIPVLLRAGPVDIEGGYAAVTELGHATGHVAEAEEVIATMRAEIEAALAEAPDSALRIYHELDQSHYSVSSSGFIGAVYAALGTDNIADAADPDGYGFPQLTEEYIIEADPELIVITDLTGYTAEDVAARPGWESITAVRDGNILTVDADIASRWGPRLPLFVAVVAEALAEIAAAP